MRQFVILAFFLTASLMNTSCQSDGTDQTAIKENNNGSKPINKEEEAQYKRAILKCYKTGGTRVVKITGKLRCY